MLGGVSLGGATLRVEKVMAIDANEANPHARLQGEPTNDPTFGCPAWWIDPSQRDLAIAEGFLTVDSSTIIATQLNQLLSERAHLLLGPDEVKTLIEAIKTRASGLVETIYPTPLGLAAMTRCCAICSKTAFPSRTPCRSCRPFRRRCR
jgi:flagellar biosynthesis protein FlhA